MIQIEKIQIENFRGIRSLKLEPRRKSFAIQGPNGSGKSGVVDAIEFGLTGRISRLGGTGTRGVSLKRHGPHIDAIKDPASTFVRLTVFLTRLNKSVVLTRNLKSPTKPTIEPSDPDVKNAIEHVAKHNEITLTRRQLVRLVLSESTKRSDNVQTLLRLESLGKMRKALKTALTNCERELRRANGDCECEEKKLKTELELPSLSEEDICAAVNTRRECVGLQPINKFGENMSLPDGLSGPAHENSHTARIAAHSKIRAIRDSLKSEPVQQNVNKVNERLKDLDSDPDLTRALQYHQLVKLGLSLTDEHRCPLCDTAWEDENLLNHLRGKLKKCDEAAVVEDEILKAASALSDSLGRVAREARSLLKATQELELTDLANSLQDWLTKVEHVCGNLERWDEIVPIRSELADLSFLSDLGRLANEIEDAVRQLPGPTTLTDASFQLALAQTSVTQYLRRKAEKAEAERVFHRARAAYRCFCDAVETEIARLYTEVEDSFIDSYRRINSDDEGQFTASLDATEKKLDLNVDFYNRGRVHPGAYHSEGHQDGMGLCLYLALMQQVFGQDLRLVILDDVVMAVDSRHRREICRLLKDKFPNTQFIITTHEKIWLKQMQESGLIEKTAGVQFRSWSLDSGPIATQLSDSWQEIVACVDRNEIDVAAWRLRRYLESVCSELAELLGAQVAYREDGSYGFAELLERVTARLKKYAKDAEKAARDWKNVEQETAANDLLKRLKDRWQPLERETWVVNPAVHYNPWENFVKEDFAPVVQAVHALLECFRCPKCEKWLYVTPRHKPDTVRCACNQTSLNLQRRPTA